MNGSIVSALVLKDLRLFSRNRFFAFITVLGLVAYAAIYYLMPSAVNETLEIGLFAPSMPAAFAEQMAAGGLVVREAESEEALKEAMANGDYNAGLVLPADFVEMVVTGQKSQIKVYYSSDLPAEFHDAFTVLFREMAFALSGQALNIEVSEEIMGTDMVGMQIPPRDRLLPLFAVVVLLMETMGLASLLAVEIETGTLQALLVTPLRIEGLFLAKGITGVGLTFGQAALLMGVTGGLHRHPLLVLLALLLGALLVTGIGFLMASVARDMMSVLAWGVLSMLVLGIPSFGVIFPGTMSDWVRIIPSYYMIDTVFQVANFNAAWGDVWPNLLTLLAFSAVLFVLGVMVLRRKLR